MKTKMEVIATSRRVKLVGPHKVFLLFAAVFAMMAAMSAAEQQETAGGGAAGIDELDAVIEFDESDDLFMLLTSRESTCVHLYERQDPQYLAKRKAFRKAAKRDIDASKAVDTAAEQVTQWISVDKELLMASVRGRQTSLDNVE